MIEVINLKKKFKDTEFVSSLKGGAPVLYDTYDKALRDLEIGRTSAVAGDEVLIRYYMSQLSLIHI